MTRQPFSNAGHLPAEESVGLADREAPQGHGSEGVAGDDNRGAQGLPREAPTGPTDLEVKDALLIFNAVWHDLESSFPVEQLSLPREIFWINGAPGAGKGTHTQTAMRLRDLTAPPIVMSSLLDSPKARELIDAGMLVGDKEVISILLHELLKPDYRSGAVVDGFPRTKVQVETLKLLHEKMTALHAQFRDTLYAPRFRKPQFHILVLFVDEAESVRRQLERGRKALEHNLEVEESGIGELMEIRRTDTNADAARKRYRVFKEQTYEALKSLREVFLFHFINTHGTIAEVRDRIIRELQYQSSLELEQATYDAIAPLPLATSLAAHARQQLVERLDTYQAHQSALFGQVIAYLRERFVPILQRHALSGSAVVNTEDALFESPDALAMLIDILTERGFQVRVNVRREEIPESVDPKTFRIQTRTRRVVQTTVTFPTSHIRH